MRHLLSICFLLFSSQLLAQEMPVGPNSQQFFVDGALREVHFYVPESYDGEKGAPLVLMLHGEGENGQVCMRKSGWQEWAEEFGAVVVFPTAGAYLVASVDDELPTTMWSSPGFRPDEGDALNDLVLIDSVYDFAMRTFHMDPARVFVAGFGSGAEMAFSLGLERPHYFSGVGMAAGLVNWGALEKKNLSGSIPRIVYLLGAEDQAFLEAHDASSIPFRTSTILKSAVGQYLAKMRQYSSVSPTPVRSEVVDNLLVMDFAGKGDAAVRLLVVDKMGHLFPHPVRDRELKLGAAGLMGNFFLKQN